MPIESTPSASRSTPEPYFSTRRPDSERPRLLLISYHFPPRHSAGALRWRKFAPFLHGAGWDLDVLTTPPTRVSSDGGLSELPPGVELYAVPEQSGRLRRAEDGLARWIRERGERHTGTPTAIPGGESSETELMIPASQLSWVPRSLRDLIRIYHVLLHHEETRAWSRSAARLGNVLATANRYRGVLASAPPWSTLLASGWLASAHSLPLILDFRDPWSLPRPLMTESDAHPLGLVLAERCEAEAVRVANAVIMNTPTAERGMVARYPGAKVCTILNGVDDVFHDDVPNSDEPFRIVYAGTIYIDRDPRLLFDAVGSLVREEGLGPNDVEVEFIGQADLFMGVPTRRLAEDAGIGEYFHLVPSMPREELLGRLRRASVLVSLPQSTPLSMPSKIYEYMGFNARLLVYAAAGSSTAEVLATSNAIVLDPTDRDGTVEALRRCYREHRSGSATHREFNVGRFARKHRGAELQALLREVGLIADGVAR